MDVSAVPSEASRLISYEAPSETYGLGDHRAETIACSCRPSKSAPVEITACAANFALWSVAKSTPARVAS